MAVVIQCLQCHSRFSAAENLIGQQVQCPQCRTVFVAQPEVTPSQPIDARWKTLAGNSYSPATSAGPPNVEGPTDSQMRMIAGACIPIFLLGMAVSYATWDGPQMGRTVVLGIGPFAVFFSVAALIDPNIARAAGKFGKHLPARYKAIAGVIGVASLLVSAAILTPLLIR